MEKLFIGGSQDGKRINVHETQRIRFPVSEPTPTLWGDPLREFTEQRFGHEEYEQRFLRWGTKEFSVYVLSCIDSDAAMDMLIMNYRQNSVDKVATIR